VATHALGFEHAQDRNFEAGLSPSRPSKQRKFQRQGHKSPTTRKYITTRAALGGEEVDMLL
jgi:hypothetical protein